MTRDATVAVCPNADRAECDRILELKLAGEHASRAADLERIANRLDAWADWAEATMDEEPLILADELRREAAKHKARARGPA